MAEIDPHRASDYDDRTTSAVKSVLLEIGQVLGSYRGKFTVIGGAVPWLLLKESDMRHIGTLDVDLSLNAAALGDGEYAQLVESLLRRGYHQPENRRRFQLVRTVPARDGGADIDIIVDFLRPHDAMIAKNVPPLVPDFAVQPADGADLALRFHEFVPIDGDMPEGGKNRVQLPVASIHRDPRSGQQVPKTVDRQMRRLSDQSVNQLPMRFQEPGAVTADLARRHAPRRSVARNPLRHRGDADTEARRHLADRLARQMGPHHALSKVTRIGLCHPCWPPSPVASLNHIP